MGQKKNTNQTLSMKDVKEVKMKDESAAVSVRGEQGRRY